MAHKSYRRRITRLLPTPLRRHNFWLAFTAGVAVGVGGLVAAEAVRRRTKSVPPPDLSATLPKLPEPAPATSTAGERPTRAPDYRLRAMFVVAVLVAVAAAFLVHHFTADTFEPAATYPFPLVPTAQPRPLPAGNLPDLPRATSTETYPTNPSWNPYDGVIAPAGPVPRSTKVIMARLNGDPMTVSIDDVDNARPRTHQTLPAFPLLRPARGNRLVFVEVSVENTGHTAFPAHIGPFHSSISDREGHVYQPDTRLTNAVNSGPEPAPLAPNWLLVGELVFEVKASAEVTCFRFGPWPAVSQQTQEWSLTDG